MSRWIGAILCLFILSSLPLSVIANILVIDKSQITESPDEYQEIQLLPDTSLESNYSFEENDDHNAFYTDSLLPGAELVWAHQDGVELDFRYPKDRTMNLPDCKEYAIVYESFNWDYNVFPTQAVFRVQYNVELDGDFDTVTYPLLFNIYFWIIDSSNQWTELYKSTDTNGKNIIVYPGFQQTYRGWDGLIENSAGIQQAPTDTLKFAIGISPSYEFYENEHHYWNWMNGAVRVTISSMRIDCVFNPNPEEKDLLAPTTIRTSGTQYDDICADLAFLEDGSIFVVGTSYSDPSVILLTKWSSTGNLRWTRTLGADESCIGYGVATNDAYVVTTGSIADGNTTDTILAKWNHRGALIWNKSFDLGGSDYGLFVDFGIDGSIYLLGTYQGIVAPVAYLAKFSADGTLQWIHTCGNQYGDRALDMGVAYDGYVYTSTFQNMSKWSPEGIIEWSNSAVYGSVKVTRDGEIYSTRLFYPTNLLQQWLNNGSKGWNISLTFNHPYFNETQLTPRLIDVTPAGWAYVLSFARWSLADVFLGIYDTEGILLWNQTIDPQYFCDPYYYITSLPLGVHKSGFVCFAPSIMTDDGDLDFCIQLYLSERAEPIVTNPLTILLIGVAIVIVIAIPLDFRRRKRKFIDHDEFGF